MFLCAKKIFACKGNYLFGDNQQDLKVDRKKIGKAGFN